MSIEGGTCLSVGPCVCVIWAVSCVGTFVCMRAVFPMCCSALHYVAWLQSVCGWGGATSRQLYVTKTLHGGTSCNVKQAHCLSVGPDVCVVWAPSGVGTLVCIKAMFPMCCSGAALCDLALDVFVVGTGHVLTTLCCKNVAWCYIMQRAVAWRKKKDER